MPVFSELTITFENDWVDGDSFAIVTSLASVPTNYTTNFVVLRSGANEVTAGTPTATPGETSAINYKAAFDLDNPIGFVVTQTLNEVVIGSETLGEDFTIILLDTGNTGRLSYVFDNYSEPITPANINTALVRSPHYVNMPFYSDTTTKATLELFIWSGDLTAIPVEATEVLTKIRPTIDYAEFNANLSTFIKSRINPEPNFSVVSVSQIVDSEENSIKWCYFNVEFTDPSAEVTPITGYVSSLDGFGYYAQGVNPSVPSNDVLTDVTKRKIASNGIVLLPFYNNGSITSIDVDTEGAEVNDNHVITSTNESTEYVQYVSVDVSQILVDKIITITVNPSGDTFTYYITDECRYEAKTIPFKNRYGVFETFSMFKKSNVTLNVEKSEFVNAYIQDGVYDTTAHQYKDISIQGKETIKLNSGYINELENEIYKQCLLSDQVWFYEDGVLVPIKPVTSSLEYKTRVNDKLVNYSLEFSYAYNQIQNV